MFSTYDLIAFGNRIRKIRQMNGLSQTDVRTETGINEDTLRKIENGLVIPKYETLEILSDLYKCDLLKLLQHSRMDKHFYQYYCLIDRIIANNEISLLDEVIQDFKACFTNKELQNNLINKSELQQFEAFLVGIKEYNSDNLNRYSAAQVILINALKMTIKNFNIGNFKNFHYSLLEIRILLLIGLLKERINETTTCIEILKFIIEYLDCNNEVHSDIQNIILKSFANLSYNYHRIDQHELALKYADDGIDYAVKNSKLDCLYILYARKGIAEYLLNDGNYMDSLNKSVQILEIGKKYELAGLYRDIFLKKYSIKL